MITLECLLDIAAEEHAKTQVPTAPDIGLYFDTS
jgi:hypothetical protein